MANRTRNPMARHDADSRVPRYLQVASVLRRRIRDGHWAVGDKIATLEELEREFNVARVTVRQAIDLLQRRRPGEVVPGSRHLRHQGGRERPLDAARHGLGEPDRAHPRPRPQRAALRSRRLRPGSRRTTALPRRPTCSCAASRSATASPTPMPACTSRSTCTPGRRRLFASRVALAVLSEMKDVAIARAHQTVVVGAADIETARQLGIRPQRADGGGALRRHRQGRRRHLHRRDHLPRRLRAAQHRADPARRHDPRGLTP